MAGLPQLHKDLRVVNRLYGVFDLGASDVTGKVIGTLPKGAIILPGSSAAVVETVMNGTSPSITLGTVAHSDQLFAAADITEGTAGTYQMVLATLNANGFGVPLSADTDIIATLGGTGVTAGKVHFVVTFVHSLDPTTIG